jgi:hypothetical protein
MAYCAACLSVNSGELPNVALTRGDFVPGLSLLPILFWVYQSQGFSTSFNFDVHEKTAALPSVHAVVTNRITSAFVVTSGAKLIFRALCKALLARCKYPGGFQKKSTAST